MLIIILPIVIIHILFKWKSNCYWIEAEWNAGDALGYFGDVLSFVGTVVLGYIAVKQTERANKLNKELQLVKKDIKVITWQRQSLRRFFYLQQQRWRYGQN